MKNPQDPTLPAVTSLQCICLLASPLALLEVSISRLALDVPLEVFFSTCLPPFIPNYIQISPLLRVLS